MAATATTRARRSRADIEAVKAAIVEVLVEDRPMTVRQVFYRLVSPARSPRRSGSTRAR